MENKIAPFCTKLHRFTPTFLFVCTETAPIPRGAPLIWLPYIKLLMEVGEPKYAAKENTP